MSRADVVEWIRGELASGVRLPDVLADLRRDVVRDALQRTGSQSKAARALGVSVQAVQQFVARQRRGGEA